MGEALDRLRVLFARTFVVRHPRLTEYGVEDVESHWRELPPQTRQAFLDAMHAPTAPELQGDRPETRRLRDLPPGLQAVYEAVQRDVGARKAELLRAKVEPGRRSPGYLHQMVSFEEGGQPDLEAELRSQTTGLDEPEDFEALVRERRAVLDELRDAEANAPNPREGGDYIAARDAYYERKARLQARAEELTLRMQAARQKMA
jgi:hypothetical protein